MATQELSASSVVPADADERTVIAWVETNLGPVTRIERQGRWRPAWFVDALEDGKTLPLYVRADRGVEGGIGAPLKLESDLLQIFWEGGVTVPRVYGFIAEIPAIVMDARPGISGLQNAKSKADQDKVRSQLVDEMIAIHRIDPERVHAVGAPHLATAAERGLFYLRSAEAVYARQKARPAPVLEFCRSWMRRNMPTFPEQPQVCTIDAGQFIFDGDRLTAMLDFEFAGLGDPHADLAALRTRTRAEYLGDIDELYDWYEQRTGQPIDVYRVRFHTIAFGLLCSLLYPHEIAHPVPGQDIHEYIIWDILQLKDALYGLFEINGWEPETFTPPEPGPGSRDNVLMVSLEQNIMGDVEGLDQFELYRRRKQRRIARFLRLADQHQQLFEAEYCDDIAAVTGYRPTSWMDADAYLERYVIATDGSQDEALLRVCMRFVLRRAFLLADPDDTMNYTTLTTPVVPIRER